ncbi:hypothetical protein C8R47DRAFT_1151663 [Mycena vitilis]|nr:hypothetical protein C8R47DRAFT_1151663 [Mycena vitilis]
MPNGCRPTCCWQSAERACVHYSWPLALTSHEFWLTHLSRVRSGTQQNHKVWILSSPVTPDNVTAVVLAVCSTGDFFPLCSPSILCYSYPARALVTSRRCVSLFCSSPVFVSSPTSRLAFDRRPLAPSPRRLRSVLFLRRAHFRYLSSPCEFVLIIS